MKGEIRINAKCSDLFAATLIQDGKQLGEYDGYVPNWFPSEATQHFGDYVELRIDAETGQILNWKKPTQAQLKETFKT